jgi:membrane protease YdiL (CAAX protease family)
MSLFIQKAKQEGQNHGWMYWLGAIISFLAGQVLGMIPVLMITIPKGLFTIEEISDHAKLGIDTNLFFFLMLLPFITSFIVLWIFIRVVHKKRFLISFTPFDKFDWSKLFFAFALWFVMSSVYDIIFYATDKSNYEFHGFNMPSFLFLFFISMLILPIQTTFEELLFRSYLMQGIGMWKPYKIVPLMVTSVIFGLMHIANPEVNEYGNLVLVQYISIGFLLGLLTLQSDSMEFSLGLHAANNIYGSLIVSFKGSALKTDTLFYAKKMMVDWRTVILYLSIQVIFYLIIRYKYKLHSLQDLFQKFSV